MLEVFLNQTEEHENKLINTETWKKHKISAKKLWHTLDYDRDV